MPPANVRTTPDPATVLTRAVVRAADLLGLKNAELAQITGVSATTISRCKHGSAELDPERKAGELGLLLVRLFRSLDPLVGSDIEKRKAWMHTENEALGGVPATLIRRPEGLARALDYLDGIRAHQLGRAANEAEIEIIQYESVRSPGDTNLAVFTPDALEEPAGGLDASQQAWTCSATKDRALMRSNRSASQKYEWTR